MLLIRRGKAPRAGTWSIPGGRQELGETLMAAARREVLEETGVRAGGALSFLDVVDSLTRDPDGRVTAITTAWWTTWGSGERRRPKAASDAADARWVSPADLAGL